LLTGGDALAQSISPDAQSPSPYEPGLIVLATVLILLAGGLLFRALVRVRVAHSILWLPTVLMIVSGVVFAALHVAEFTGFPNLYSFVRFLFLLALFGSVLYPVANFLLPSQAMLTRGGVPPLLRGVAIVLFSVTGMLILLSWSFPQVSFTPMFVTSGIVSVVVGLAVQDLLGSLLAGVVISAERPFKVGDWVQIGAVEGEVTKITWRATQVRTRDNDCVLIPNNLVTKDLVKNFELPTAVHRLRIRMGLPYDTPCGLATAALVEAASHTEGVLKSPEPTVLLLDFADSAVTYELRAWIDNYESANTIESNIRKAIWYAMKRYGITIPFPQRDVNFRRIREEPEERHARMVIVNGPMRGTLYNLSAAPTIFGRSPECSVVMSDPRVSNQHAVIEPDGDRYRLRDLDSRHGTLVNGRKITSDVLDQGDMITIGSVNFVFETNRAPLGARLPPSGPTDDIIFSGSDSTQA
jgi:small-conductance mechanosensitive channel